MAYKLHIIIKSSVEKITIDGVSYTESIAITQNDPFTGTLWIAKAAEGYTFDASSLGFGFLTNAGEQTVMPEATIQITTSFKDQGKEALDTGYIYGGSLATPIEYANFTRKDGHPAKVVPSTPFSWGKTNSTNFYNNTDRIVEVKKGTQARFAEKLFVANSTIPDSSAFENIEITRTNESLKIGNAIFYPCNFIDGVIPTCLLVEIQGAGGSGGGDGGGGGASGGFWLGVIKFTNKYYHWILNRGRGGLSVNGSNGGKYGCSTELYCADTIKATIHNDYIFVYGGEGGHHRGTTQAEAGQCESHSKSNLIFPIKEQTGKNGGVWGGDTRTIWTYEKIYLTNDTTVKESLFNYKEYLQAASGQGHNNNGGGGGAPSRFSFGGDGGDGWGATSDEGKPGFNGSGGGGVGDSGTAYSGRGGDAIVTFYY